MKAKMGFKVLKLKMSIIHAFLLDSIVDANKNVIRKYF